MNYKIALRFDQVPKVYKQASKYNKFQAAIPELEDEVANQYTKCDSYHEIILFFNIIIVT